MYLCTYAHGVGTYAHGVGAFPCRISQCVAGEYILSEEILCRHTCIWMYMDMYV